MAEDTGGEKTLPASAQKKRKAREEGNVARSQDLSAGAVLAIALLAMVLFGRPSMEWMVEAGRFFIGGAGDMRIDETSPQTLAIQVSYWTAMASWQIIAMLLVGGLALNLMQVGVLFTAKPLQPKLSRLNPFTGMTRFFSMRSAMELAKSLAKLAAVTGVVYFALRTRVDELPYLMELTPWGLVVAVSQLVVDVWWRIALAMLAIGILDYGFQWWQHDQDLRMTYREARDEAKELEGDPHIKRRIRQLQRQAAAQRMMKEVPKADVIITNPVRYAVALRYDPQTMESPRVTAKGARLVAQRIRDLAVEHDVPIVQKPELARAMFRNVEVGQAIPEDLFHAVAEVLSFVYRIDRREAKRRERQTLLAKAG